MDSEIYDITASAIDRCPLTVIDTSCTPHVNRLITRNKRVLEFLGVEDIPFQHRDPETGILQVYDIFSKQTLKLNLEKLDLLTYFCMPGWISPASVANGFANSEEFEVFLFQQMEPFLNDVRDALNDDQFTDCAILTLKEEILFLAFIGKLTDYKIKTRDQKTYTRLFSGFHKRCNRHLLNYVKKYYPYITLFPILSLCNDKTKFETVEDIVDYVSNKEELFDVWKNFLQKSSQRQIKKYEDEYEKLCKTKFAGDEFQQERDFVELQYAKAINDVKLLNYDRILSLYKDNIFLLLRYWPIEIDPIPELENVKMLQHYEHIVLVSLYMNDISLKLEDIDFTEVDLFNKSIIDQFNERYLQFLKTTRMQQIREHAEKIILTVQEEIGDLEQEDIDDIVTSIKDFDSFQERLDSLDNIASVLQYWPSILLPAPDYVRRLGGITWDEIEEKQAQQNNN